MKMNKTLTFLLILSGVYFLNTGVALSQQPRVEFNFSNRDKASAHYNIAVNFARKGDLEKAIKEFKLSLDLDPLNYNACYNLGVAYASLNKFDEAINWYKKVITLKPDDANTYYNLAICLTELNREDEAEKYYLKAIEFKKDFVEAHANLAMYYLKKEKNDKYNQELAIIEKLDPKTAAMIKKSAQPSIRIEKK